MEVTTDHLKWVKRYINQVRSPTAPLLDPEDLAQEGWISMWVAAEKAKESGREINDAYLKQAARWTVLNGLKRRYPDIPLDPQEIPEGSYDVDPSGAAHNSIVLEAVKALPTRQREYVFLRFWADYSSRDLSTRDGYSTSLWYNPKTGAKELLKKSLWKLSTAV